MRLQVFHLVLVAGASDAFSPIGIGIRHNSALSLGVDPSLLGELPNHMQSLHDAFTSISLSDALDAAPDVSGVVDAVQDTVQAVVPAASVAEEAAKDSGNGWFGFLTGPTEGLLQLIHSALVAVGLNQDAWGVSIIAMTIVIKLLTFPLTKTQLESTNKMQALQPTIKEIQAKYQSNPEVMNQKIAEVYQSNQVNPLAGCLPSLVQIPVFIGLYRAVLDLAKENKLDEPFLWLPNLEGPTYGADPTHGSDWILTGWVDGVPSLGWDDTAAFLVLPVVLVVSQFISMELMTPKNSEQQGNFILKLLPLMIGWFSLNVPAALCVYWIVNNVVTTATSVLIRSGMESQPAMSTGGAAAVSTPPPQSSVFAPPPMREKPAGFSSPVISDDDIKPITSSTSVVDAEVVADIEDSGAGDVVDQTPPAASTQPKKSKRKKRKKRN